MLSFSGHLRIFVCNQATDMRRSFDGLSALVQGVIQQDPVSGNLYLFRNRGGDRLKILYWDRDGLAIWYKRLEKGTFELPAGDTASVEITETEFTLLLGGVALDAPRRKRYRLPSS
jgi:transposase